MFRRPPAEVDPDNRLLWRMPLRRLEAEMLWDALLSVSGQLDLTPFGPPDGVDVRGDGLVTPVRSERGWRRGIFLQQRRTQIPTLLESFDFPQMGPNCLSRNESTVAPQALHLFNNALVHDLAGCFAARLRRDAGPDPVEQVRRANLLAFGRPPAPEELRIGVEALDALARQWQTADAGLTSDAARTRALAGYCHALLNSAEFLFLD